MKTGAWLADLMRLDAAIAELPGDRERAQFVEDAARFLGLQRVPAPVAAAKQPAAELLAAAARAAAIEPADAQEPAAPLPEYRHQPAPFLRVVSFEPASNEARERVERQRREIAPSRPIAAADLAPRASAPPDLIPLEPWNTTLARLRRTVVAARRPAIELDAIVDDAARGRPIRLFRVPRRRRFGGLLTILLDRSPRLRPFAPDQRGLVSRLLPLVGSASVVVRTVSGDPDHVVAEWHRGAPRRPRAPAPGSRILALSDLGGYGTARERAAWLRLGRSLRAAGCALSALSLCPPAMLANECREAWNVRPWEPQSAAAAGALEPAHRKLRAERLLGLLATAVTVEPELLRAVRKLLPHDLADVTTEADAWLAPEVARSPTAMVVRRDHRAALQERAALELGEYESRAVESIGQHHRARSRLIWAEELLRMPARLRGLLPHADWSDNRLLLRLIADALRAHGSHNPVGLDVWLANFHVRSPEWAEDAELADAVRSAVAERVAPFRELPLSEHITAADVAAAAAGALQAESTWAAFQAAHGLAFEPWGPTRVEPGHRGPWRGSPVWLGTARHAEVFVRQSAHETRSAGPLQLYGDVDLSSAQYAFSIRANRLRVSELATGKALLFSSGLRSAVRAVRKHRGDQPELAMELPDGSRLVARAQEHTSGRYLELAHLELKLDDERSYTWRKGAEKPTLQKLAIDSTPARVALVRDWHSHVPVPSPPFHLETDLGRWTVDRITRPSWASAIGRDRFGLWADFVIQGIRQRMRWIPPGRFWMGSPEDESGRFDNETRHEVVLTQGYWLGETPVTQALYTAVVGKNPSHFVDEGHEMEPDRPVEQVSWHDAVAFAKAVRKALPSDRGENGASWRLPTEAEWEHACRAGTATALYTGPIEIRGENDAPALDAIAWYGGNSGREYDLKKGVDPKNWPNRQYDDPAAGTRRVKQKAPNGHGLYDMLGNVWEWCHDWFEPHRGERAVDPHGPNEGGLRVLRGGSWISNAQDCRSASRDLVPPVDLDFDWWLHGFRLARGPGWSSGAAEPPSGLPGPEAPRGRRSRPPRG